MRNDASGIFCIGCGKKITTKQVVGGDRVLSCDCFEYPQVFGISYLFRSRLSNEAVKLLKNGKRKEAFQVLLGVQSKLFWPIYIFAKYKLSRFVGFETFVKILRELSLDRGWASYLISRRDSNYYQISSMLLERIKGKNLRIVDIGCGTGHFLSEVEKSKNYAEVIGIDKIFLNLVLAKLYFCKKTVLVCCDVEDGLPFSTKRFDWVHLNDAFQGFKKKDVFLSEASRIMKKDALLSVVHTHKMRIGKYIYGIDAQDFVKRLKKVGIKNIWYVSDELLHLKLRVSDSLLGFSEALDVEDKDGAYSILASKGNFAKLRSHNKRKNYVFLSPHLDDVVLSAGNLITKLRNLESKVSVVTVFTEAGEKVYSESGAEHLDACGFKDAKKLFEVKRKEDVSAMNLLGVDHLHLGFVDGAFRKDEVGRPIYDESSDLFSGEISGKDKLLTHDLKYRLAEMISDNTVLFAPLGIGAHVDHVLVREVIESLGDDVYYWEDFPYSMGFEDEPQGMSEVFELGKYNAYLKTKAIKMYRSQYKMLFPRGKIPISPEIYWSKT